MPGPWFPAITKADGVAMAMPNVCLVPGPPPVPTPFPSIARLTGAEETIDAVLIMNKETVVESSKIPSSMGDEAGSGGGVISGVHGDQVVFRSASSKVKAKGKKVVFVTAPSAHNGANANAPMGLVVSTSQSKVLVAL
jgi:hypothetical protein